MDELVASDWQPRDWNAGSAGHDIRLHRRGALPCFEQARRFPDRFRSGDFSKACSFCITLEFGTPPAPLRGGSRPQWRGASADLAFEIAHNVDDALPVFPLP